MRSGKKTDGGRAELERLAKLDNRLGTRARVALALGEGAAPAAVVARLGVTFTTVRAVRRRLEHGGVAALKERYAPGRAPAPVAPLPPPSFKAPVPAVLLARAKAEPRHGPPPTARLAVEVWARDAAALGIFPPGARLPDLRWLARRFGTTPRVLRQAFAALAREGWLRAVPRQGVFLAERLPFANRYLMLLTSPVERPKPQEGIDAALERAAREQEARRGVQWAIREAIPVNDPDYPGLLASIAEQRWAGVFLRAGVRIPGSREGQGHYSFLDRVPIAGFLHPILRLGSHAARLHIRSAEGDALDALLPVVRAAGARRALVLAVALPDGGAMPTEEDARRRARAAGVEIPPECFVPCSVRLAGQMDVLAGLALHIAEDERCDAILALQDNFAEPLDRALVARYGVAEATRRYRLAAWGSFPITQKTVLPFAWRGLDLAATLDAFVAWCDAIHAGAHPPPPQVVEWAGEG